MSDVGTDATNPNAVAGKAIAEDVAKVIGHLRGGKATRTEAIDVKKAAENAIAGHDLARGVGQRG